MIKQTLTFIKEGDKISKEVKLFENEELISVYNYCYNVEGSIKDAYANVLRDLDIFVLGMEVMR